MDSAVYYLRSKRTARAQRNSHLVAGFGMLALGVEELLGDTPVPSFKPILQIIAGGLLFAVVVIEMLRAKKEHPHEMELADFFAALVAVVEGALKIHHDGFWSSHLSQLWFAVAIMFVLRGFYFSKLPKWSRLALTNDEFVYRRPFRRSKAFKWHLITDIQISDTLLMIEASTGAVLRIDLTQYEQPEKIAEWCRTQTPRFRQSSGDPSKGR